MTDQQLTAFRSFPIGGNLPNRLKLAMLLNGMSMRELARKSGVHRDTLLSAAHGRETMRVETAKRLAGALDLTIEDIFPPPELWPED